MAASRRHRPRAGRPHTCPARRCRFTFTSSLARGRTAGHGLQMRRHLALSANCFGRAVGSVHGLPPPSGHALTQGQMPRRHLDSGWGRVHHRDVRCTRTRDTALNDPCHSIKPILSCCSSSSSSPAAANAGGARPTVPFRHDLEQAFLYFYYTADDAHTNTPRCLYCYPHIMILPTLYMYI